MNLPSGLQLQPSPVDGLGIFAQEDFPSGFFFGFFEGVEYSLKDFKEKYGKDTRYCYQLGRQNKILCAKEKRNWITYLNESSDPNCLLKKRGCWSSRPIQKGEELFLCYDKNGVVKYPRTYTLGCSASDSLLSEFYDLWDCSDTKIVKKAYEIRDSALSCEEKRKQLAALQEEAFSRTK